MQNELTKKSIEERKKVKQKCNFVKIFEDKEIIMLECSFCGKKKRIEK